MCLLFVGWHVNPKYPLLVAGNRDEFRRRKTAPLAVRENGSMLCGLDEEGGGTWLGISADQRFCGLTNFRQGIKRQPHALSRGNLVMDFLREKESGKTFLLKLSENVDEYRPFNILAGDRQRLFFFSSVERKIRLLEPGFYGLSNGMLDEPWPKLIRGKMLLRKPLLESEEIRPEIVFQCLQDNFQPSDDTLPATGVSLEWERFLASVFIDGGAYGTRSSALIKVNLTGRIDFFEKSYAHENGQTYRDGLVHCTLNA